MKKRAKSKAPQKQKQKQKQSVNIKNIITIGKSKRVAKKKQAPQAAAPRQAPTTMMTTVYNQYFNPPERNPMRSVVAQVINPVADNVLLPVAAAERIIEGKVQDDLLREKQRENEGLSLEEKMSSLSLDEGTRTWRSRRDDEKEKMRFVYGEARKNVVKDVKRKIEIERNRPPPPFDLSSSSQSSPSSPPFRIPIFHFDD